MKSIAFALVASFLVVASAAHAQTPTHYQTIEKMFNQATKPALADLEAAYVGRCYIEFADKDGIEKGPNDATGSLLVGKALKPQVDPADDGGPLFPVAQRQSQTKLNLFNAVGDDSHYRFDAYTLTQAYDAFSSPAATSTSVVDDGREYTWHSDYSLGAKAEFALRRSTQGYLIVKGVNSSPGPDYPSPVMNFFCYFYKQIK